jgi:PPOX class probable F420-dependent enzyme
MGLPLARVVADSLEFFLQGSRKAELPDRSSQGGLAEVAPGAPALGATSRYGARLVSQSMSVLNAAARDLIESGKPAHLVTVNPDGSPQLTLVWVGLDGDEIVCGHLDDRQKLRNVRRDPRVVLSLETGVVNDFGLAEYLVLTGSGRVTEGGAADLLQRLAHAYLGPGVTFPPGENHPPGYILHITPKRVGGIGPWRD